MLDAALEYVAPGREWKIFPCISGTKRPATPHGLQDATTDPEIIRRWFRNGRCNIAVATGTGSIDVVDIDVHPDKNGFAALRRIAAAGLVKDSKAVVRTPSGGAHLYFRGTQQRNGRLYDHDIDFRGDGGYVLLPPSTVNGNSYRFEEQNWDRDAEVDWDRIKWFLTPPKPVYPEWDGGRRSLQALVNFTATQMEGNRNSGTHWAMCRAAEARESLEPLIQAAISNGLSEHEVRATARSAQRAR